ncbi:putative CmcJ-like methyltransferase [Podospora didyma]|uniref:CmcJ-like methyltransferase n=1 Tax=Podospora didyma TaxID=330526 RepID=A0AAE0K8V8_9PEZI|nr:putative CmcJ-like methyltransferase [Podospora didyma]
MAIDATVHYIARDEAYKAEKAFDTGFPVSHIPGARQTNHRVEPHGVKVHQIRDPSRYALDVHGFCVIRADLDINPHDAVTQLSEIQFSIWDKLERILERDFPQYTRIESYDLNVRKRDSDFPSITRGYTDFNQPSRKPHCDVSQQGALMDLRFAFPGQDHIWAGKDFDILSVWLPLVGPNSDWPLVLCDWTTVDPDNDIIDNDAIHRDHIEENSLLHYNSAHKWYYIKNQTSSDLMVFRNADSCGRRPRGFHCSIFNPDVSGPPRQSIEVRLVAFR